MKKLNKKTAKFFIKCIRVNERFVDLFKNGILLKSAIDFDNIYKKALIDINKRKKNSMWIKRADTISKLGICEYDIIEAEKFELSKEEFKNNLKEIVETLDVNLTFNIGRI